MQLVCLKYDQRACVPCETRLLIQCARLEPMSWFGQLKCPQSISSRCSSVTWRRRRRLTSVCCCLAGCDACEKVSKVEMVAFQWSWKVDVCGRSQSESEVEVEESNG
jgi:hypothetical protein